MVSIILFIIKIIGILLAVILGVILLTVFSVLFIPVSYSGNGEIHNTIDSMTLKAKVHWLFGIVRFDFQFSSMKHDWNGYFLKFQLNKTKKNKTKKTKDNSKGRSNEKSKKKNKSVSTTNYKNNEKIENVITETNFGIKENCDQEKAEVKSKKKKENNKPAELQRKEINQDISADNKFKKRKEKKNKKSEKNKEKKKFKIMHTISKICDTIKLFVAKKENLLNLYYMEVHQYAIKKIKLQCIYLFKHLKPKRLEINASVGFEDPSMTGKFLALLGVLFPFYGDTCNITPDFYNQIYDGTIIIKGKLRIFHFVRVFIRLVRDKYIRKTYRNLKEYKF